MSIGASRTLPSIAVSLVCLWLAIDDGGFYTRTWTAAAVVSAGLVLVLALAAWNLRGRSTTASRLALASVAALTVWSFATAVWAAAPGNAVDGAIVTAVYLAVFGIPVAWPSSPRGCEWLLRAVAFGLAALGAVAVVRVARGSGDLVYARLAWPTGYPNATAAIDALGAWLALTLATRAGARVVRAASFGAGVWLGGIVVLTQSRGAVFTAPLAALVLVLLARQRLATVLQLALATVVLVPVLPRLLGVLDEPAAAREDAVVHAAVALAVAAAVAAAVHAVVSPRLDRLRPGPAPRVAKVGAVALLVLVLVAVAASTSPAARVHDAWREFAGAAGTDGSTRFTALGSNRADFWRVGWDEFVRHPVGGIGVDNFQAAYLRERRSDEEPRAPHSVAVRAVSETGLVGAVLLAAAVVGIAAALVPVARRAGPESAVAHASAVALVGWLAHAGLDWLWEMPASGALAFAVAGIGVGATVAGPGPMPPARPLLRLAVGVAAAAVGLAAGALWLADRFESRAIAAWRTHPAAADRDLRRAARLDPLGTDALVLRGSIAARRGRWSEMRAAYAAAAGRDASDWFVQRELAVAEARVGDRVAAVAAARRATALNPREPRARAPLPGG